MTKRKTRKGSNHAKGLTVGVTAVAALLATLFLTVAIMAVRAGAFYVGYFGPVWEKYNGDGLIHPNREPVFFCAMIAVFLFEGLACVAISFIGAWHSYRLFVKRTEP